VTFTGRCELELGVRPVGSRVSPIGAENLLQEAPRYRRLHDLLNSAVFVARGTYPGKLKVWLPDQLVLVTFPPRGRATETPRMLGMVVWHKVVPVRVIVIAEEVRLEVNFPAKQVRADGDISFLFIPYPP
jgi:hypothetical protein